MNQSIQIICPVYNEVQNVENFFNEFSKITQVFSDRYSVSYLFLDNASNDGTYEKLVEMCNLSQNIAVLRYSRNYGAMKSIYTGLTKSTGDAVAVFDCDLQDPPELILKFILAWESGAKVVFGIRAKRAEGFLMTISRKSFRQLERFFKGYKSELESGAWLLDRRVVQEVCKRPFEPFLAGLIGRLGFATRGIHYERKSRMLGSSKFNLVLYFSYAMDGLVSGTIAPLRIAIFIGAVLSLFSLFSALYFVFAKFFLGIPFASGVAAIIIIVLFSFSINFVFLGIIGEYVGRIYLSRESAEPAIIEHSIGLSNKDNG